MNGKAVLLIIIAVVVALLALYIGGFFGTPSVNAPVSAPSPAPANVELPPVTAENSTPDAIVSALLEPDNQETVAPTESDPSLTAANDQIMNSFDQSFDTSQF